MNPSQIQKKGQKKSSLGRGLGSLLSNPVAGSQPQSPVKNPEPVQRKVVSSPSVKAPAAPQIKDTEKIWKIGIEQLTPNPKNPRAHFEPEALRELSESIKAQGVIQPLIARRLSGQKFELIAGERRWRAAQMAGLKDVPVVLGEVDDEKSVEWALIENIQREDLNPIEESEGYRLLAQKYKLTQQEISERVGKDRATVANLMRLSQLGEPVRKMVAEGEISLGIAKLLISVEGPQQHQLAKKIKDLNMTVRGAEKMIAGRLNQANTEPSLDGLDARIHDRNLKALTDELQRRFGTKVEIKYKNGKGRLQFSFHTSEQFDGMIEKLRGR